MQLQLDLIIKIKKQYMNMPDAKIEATKESMMGLIKVLMATWEISINDLFENPKTKLLIVEKEVNDNGR